MQLRKLLQLIYDRRYAMDVLRPELVWLDGRCYRIDFQHSSSREDEEGQFGEESMLSTRFKYFFLILYFR